MRRPIVAGNWKMHGSRAANAELVQAITRDPAVDGDIDTLLCPPFVYLSEIVAMARDSGVAVGAQNLSAESVGAYTGEVSAQMLADVGCTFVIVGHLERRLLYHESDTLVARKFAAARARGVTPILCVGEQLDDREGGHTHRVVSRQLDAVLELCGVEALAQGVIAYEPCWAIGTGRTATPEQAQEVHALSARGSRSAMLELPLLFASSTAAASRQAMRPRFSRCRMSMAGSSAEHRSRRMNFSQSWRLRAAAVNYNMLHVILNLLQMSVAVGIVGLVLLQRGKGADAGAGFGSGASGTVFGARGASTVLSRATAILAAIFMLNSLLLTYLSAHDTVTPQKTLLDRAAETQPALPARALRRRPAT